jgi:hypothetical protein
MPSGVCSRVTSSCLRTPSGAGLVLSSYREAWCVVITLSSALVLRHDATAHKLVVKCLISF